MFVVTNILGGIIRNRNDTINFTVIVCWVYWNNPLRQLIIESSVGNTGLIRPNSKHHAKPIIIAMPIEAQAFLFVIEFLPIDSQITLHLKDNLITW